MITSVLHYFEPINALGRCGLCPNPREAHFSKATTSSSSVERKGDARVAATRTDELAAAAGGPTAGSAAGS